MIFSLAIYAAPYSSQASDSAYRFATALLDQGHKLYRIFFYHDAVHNASSLATPSQDEAHLPQQWLQLSEKHGIDLVVCIAAALKRGLLNQQEADRHEKPGFNLAGGFTLGGLGQLVDAAVTSDRLITFGN
ncbi:MAG TPA: sulfurtransferase complex subunit TusD [Cellvibrio sp.]|nr:sulfurtransferase complex subunit TusD [Cellvibrio sp.]